MGTSHAGRTVVISGAAAGIGQALAQRLAADGAQIVIADLSDAPETIALVEQAGSAALSVRVDVSSAEGVADLRGQALSRFGTVDALIHNAGIYPITPFADITFEEWRRVMSVNLDSMFHLTHEFLPGMREQGWGRVVAMVSNVFHAGRGGFTHYVASKGGLIGFVRSLAAEVGQEGVTVNAIAPSLVHSKGTTGFDYFDDIEQLQAIKRAQEPSDLTGAASFLTSDDAAYITGQTLVVDGGWVRV